MARSFLSFTFALATATLILLGAGATPAVGPANAVWFWFYCYTAGREEVPRSQERPSNYLVNTRDMPSDHQEAERGRAEISRTSLGTRVDVSDSRSTMNQPAAAQFRVGSGRPRIRPAIRNPMSFSATSPCRSGGSPRRRWTSTRPNSCWPSTRTTKRKPAMEQQVLSGIASRGGSQRGLEGGRVAPAGPAEAGAKDLVAHQRLARALFWQGKAERCLRDLEGGQGD